MDGDPKRAAVVAAGVVVNVIVADASVDPAPPGEMLVDVTSRPCGIGWLYDPETETFTDPSPPPPDEEIEG
jgi:hypothetical protein